MLHLARRIAFGVNVGNFLELQRAFQRNREVNAAAQDKGNPSRGKASSPDRRRSPSWLSTASSFARKLHQLLHQATAILLVQSFPHLPQVHRQDKQRRELEVNALVDATPISGPACVINVPEASRVITDPTTLQIANVLEPVQLGFALRRDRIGRLAGLRNHHRQHVGWTQSDRDNGTRFRNPLPRESAPAFRS
jgi:hypothetical protein